MAHRTKLADILDRDDNNFALARLLAAASVVVCHAIFLATGDELRHPLTGMGRYNLGQHAVHVFFVLSGVMVAGSLDRSATLQEFVVGRVVRIIPALVVCGVVSAWIMGPLVSSLPVWVYFAQPETYLYPVQISSLAKITAYLPGVFSNNPAPSVINEPLWTLKFEVLCYGVLALIALLGAWRSNRAFVVVVALSLLLLGPLTGPRVAAAGPTLLEHFARLWLCFLLGVAFYRFRAVLPISGRLLFALALLAAFGVGSSFEPVISFALVGYGALVFAAIPLGKLRRATNRRDLSYGMYIYGWPISQTLVWAAPGIGPAIAAAISLLAAAAFGWMSWCWIEKPSLARRAMLLSLLPATRSRLEFRTS